MELNYQTRSMLPNNHATGAKVFGGLVLGGFAWGLATIAIIATSHKHVGIFRAADVQGQFLSGGAIALLVSLSILPGYLVVRGEARRIERCRGAISECKYLVRWRYAAETWAEFRSAQAAGEQKFWYGVVITMSVLCAGFAAGGIAMACSTPSANDVNGSGRMIAASIFFGFAAVCGSIAGIYAWCSNRRRQLLATPQESFVSTLGVYANGKWILWGTSRVLQTVQLKEAKEDSPVMLEFSICNGSNTSIERVLVPADQEVLAQRVAQTIMASPAPGSGGQMGTAMLIVRIVIGVLRMFA